ncbi:DoxX family protein [Streptomyces sp. NPDC006012]|uniref:DoxX family protein n=1 Tax=Streptomyces sp. NPDC006012 TaxID=3364739 RepID=UPI0036A89B5A
MAPDVVGSASAGVTTTPATSAAAASSPAEKVLSDLCDINETVKFAAQLVLKCRGTLLVRSYRAASRGGGGPAGTVASAGGGPRAGRPGSGPAPPGEVYAVIGSLSELLGGLSLALGLFVPLASAAVVGVMINAMVTVSGTHGLWDQNGGVEYNVAICVVALALAAVGPGRLALDRFFPWRAGGWPEAALALGLGGVGAAVALSV